MRTAPGLKAKTIPNLLQVSNPDSCTINPKKNVAISFAAALLSITILLGCIFLLCQAYEYVNAPYTILDGVYPSAFFLSTGFHGFHVLCGTLFLIVCLRLLQKAVYSSKRHLTFEFAAWYWHFVDVV
jgi:heme/copper-type cytochrome/quinol oxidase subunit 3